jgi:hypothetical protein
VGSSCATDVLRGRALVRSRLDIVTGKAEGPLPGEQVKAGSPHNSRR